MSSSTIVNAIAAELRAFAPFGDFGAAQLQEFASALTVVYFAAGEVVIEPSEAPPQFTYIVKSGRISGDRPGISGEAVTAIELSAGELFPIGAVLTDRPVHSTFRAAVDSFCYRMPAAAFKAQVSKSPLLQDFAERRLFNLLERSRAALERSLCGRTPERTSIFPATVELDRPRAGHLPSRQFHRRCTAIDAHAQGRSRGAG